jgi:hypothetical protein
MKRKMRKELQIGLLLFAVALTLKQFVDIPHFIFGVLMGLSISLEIVGALPERAYNSLKALKQGLRKTD